MPPNPGTDACVLVAGGHFVAYSVNFATGTVSNTATQFKVKDPTQEGICLPPPPQFQSCATDADCTYCGGVCLDRFPSGTGRFCSVANFYSDCASDADCLLGEL